MGYVKSEELRRAEMVHLMYDIYEDIGKQGPIVYAKHAVLLASCLDIDEDSFEVDCVIEGTLLDKWTDAVVYMMAKNKSEELKDLIENALKEIECYEAISELKKLNLL